MNARQYKWIFTLLTVFILSFTLPADDAEAKRWTLDVEGGYVFSGYNDVKIPNNDSAVKFSIRDDLNVDGEAYARLRLSYRLSKRHMLSALYAPLSLNASGVSGKDIRFRDVLFPKGSDLKALYRFNSYRLTWRYLLVDKPKVSLWLGFTAKIRDAEIAVESGSLKGSKANVGFVPLLNLYLHWRWSERLGMSLEADALAAKQGRAEDVALSLVYRLSNAIDLRFGYRFVEGGADNDSVYNFAMIHYLSGGFSLKF